ncbi:DUF4275 family protein [Mesobacillus subterraneus]|uniref:DUF4275 family protein n=1 Tax=Mesobacillus subterraneus TaxID=285983 RepID=A0A3R9F444_9BACI|nr:DUF4275 family protein [Mesobacillus subterraneus]RSD28606.1 DUF4275 family protein [Mesobacillus subterraneus]
MEFVHKLASKKIKVSSSDASGDQLRKKWEEVFAAHLTALEKRQIHLHNYKGANGYLWHLFSYEKRDCKKEEDADLAFDKQYKNTCLIFFQHSDEVLLVEEASDLKAKDLILAEGEYADLYIVDQEFKWTYIVTHERGWIGPFFCRR